MTRRISHERTGLYPCWRLLHPETETGKIAGQAHRQVWAYAAAVFERIPPCPLQQPVTLREAVFPPETANARMDILMPQLMKATGVTEELKAANPMKWVGLANACKAQAEELVLTELICC